MFIKDQILAFLYVAQILESNKRADVLDVYKIIWNVKNSKCTIRFPKLDLKTVKLQLFTDASFNSLTNVAKLVKSSSWQIPTIKMLSNVLEFIKHKKSCTIYHCSWNFIINRWIRHFNICEQINIINIVKLVNVRCHNIYRLSILVRCCSYNETNAGKEITSRHLIHARNDSTKWNTHNIDKQGKAT